MSRVVLGIAVDALTLVFGMPGPEKVCAATALILTTTP